MPQKPTPPSNDLELIMLAKEILKNSLGRENIAPTIGGENDRYLDSMRTWMRKLPVPTEGLPEISERRYPTGLEAKGRLFTNPNPDPYRDVETPEVREAIKIIEKEHPIAYKRQKMMWFKPIEDMGIGSFRGSINNAGFIVDPQKAMKFGSSPNPVNNLLDVIRHEMGHGIGYNDNYEAQPILPNGNYGRRPLPKDGKPRDTQDIDLASQILNRVRK